MQSKSIFEIWDEVGKLPFVVRKNFWRHRFAVVVCAINENDKGSYARGYSITFDEEKMDFVYSDYLSKYDIWNRYMLIPNSNKEEWELMPFDFFLDENLLKLYNQLKAEKQNNLKNERR